MSLRSKDGQSALTLACAPITHPDSFPAQVELVNLLIEHGADQRDAIAGLAEATGWRIVRALEDLAGRARVLELERGAA